MKNFKRRLHIIIIILGLIIASGSYLLMNVLHDRMHIPGDCGCGEDR